MLLDFIELSRRTRSTLGSVWSTYFPACFWKFDMKVAAHTGLLVDILDTT